MITVQEKAAIRAHTRETIARCAAEAKKRRIRQERRISVRINNAILRLPLEVQILVGAACGASLAMSAATCVLIWL